MESNPMCVPSREVLPFLLIKKPILSAIWYALLIYIILISSDTIPLLIGFAFVALSFTSVRFYLAILSPLPCIATVIFACIKFSTLGIVIILLLAVIWLVLYILAMKTWRHVAKGEYVISPVTNRMMYDAQYYFRSVK